MKWTHILKLVKEKTLGAGFDLVQPFEVHWYNKNVDKKYHLPTYNRKNTFGILIGNSRYLWPHFRQEISQNTKLKKSSHPLDQYTRQTILKILEEIEIPWSVFWAELHAPFKIAFQKLASISSLADLSPSHLNVHPKYGPWIAFRSAIVFNVPGPHKKSKSINLCKPCPKPCMKPFQKALRSNNWKDWLKVRQACPIGQEFQYSKSQTLYHYTKTRRSLSLPSTKTA